MRFSRIRARGVVAVSAAVFALQGAPALAQFVPYTGSTTQGYNQYQAYAPQQAQSAQQASPQFRAQPQYTAMAFQGSGSRVGVPTLNQSVESVAPGRVMQSAPMQNYSAAPAAGCNCQAAPAPAPMAYENYSAGVCANGSCGTSYNTFEGGGCGVGGTYNGCSTGYGAGSGYLGGGLSGRRGGGRQWYGGFYGLYMERDGNPWKALAFSADAANPAGYYPADNEIAVNLTDLDQDTFAGAEVRFGSTLGQCGQWGWEVAYWGLIEETGTAIVTDTQTDANRLYSMLPHTGVFYNGRTANDYFDYAPPTNDGTVGADVVRLRQLTARNSFSMQNLELNFLRFPVFGGGYYSGPAAGSYGGGGIGRQRQGLGSGYGGSCGAGGCAGGSCGVGGCDSCAGGSCGGGCGCGCGSRFSATGLFGVRYIRIDEDFGFRADFDNETAGTSGFISHNVDVDSHLVGAQFGCNMLYRAGCSGRWALHLNTVVGVFGNHTEVWNRMDAPVAGGPVTLQNGETFDLRYEDDDIAILGELRAGASYQYSCNWRLFGGYRLMGLSGMALAFDQISSQNISAAQTSYVDSDGSIFIHGLQSGVEFTY